ncbi:hypothetical protein C8F04DRAFT_1179289 [Mycena alexandri]|uniref:Uncharacterized protein n=1 Tax=Mycena alexandri TaxID=1745969 RepID=A0AAD6T440_9AGAR|nr:hypothetical protein C8F04DRAFT_1179289 [Mycena alexandri]
MILVRGFNQCQLDLLPPPRVQRNFSTMMISAVVDLESRLKLPRLRPSSSGRVRAKRGTAARTLTMTVQPTNILEKAPTTNDLEKASTAAAPSEPPAPDAAVAAPSEFLATVAPAAGGSDLPTARCVSARKRAQPDSSEAAPVSSSRKRSKKLVDSLVGWGMQDPDAGEELTGHEWVKRYPEEFKNNYKKDYQRYIEYLAQSGDS